MPTKRIIEIHAIGVVTINFVGILEMKMKLSALHANRGYVEPEKMNNGVLFLKI